MPKAKIDSEIVVALKNEMPDGFQIEYEIAPPFDKKNLDSRKKAISEKDEQIKYLNIKIKGDNAKIKILKNNSKEKESHNLKENKKKSIETEKTEKKFERFWI